MTKQIGMILVAMSVLFLIGGIWLVSPPSDITANVVKQPDTIMGTLDYIQASSFVLFIVSITAGLMFFFRVRLDRN
ncbi:MAG: hypothetical protein AABX00_05665 [Nanoarchaeota archaeon]